MMNEEKISILSTFNNHKKNLFSINDSINELHEQSISDHYCHKSKKQTSFLPYQWIKPMHPFFLILHACLNVYERYDVRVNMLRLALINVPELMN